MGVEVERAAEALEEECPSPVLAAKPLVEMLPIRLTTEAGAGSGRWLLMALCGSGNYARLLKNLFPGREVMAGASEQEKLAGKTPGPGPAAASPRKEASPGKSNLEATGSSPKKADLDKAGGGSGSGSGGGSSGSGSGTGTASGSAGSGEATPKVEKTAEELGKMTLQQLHEYTQQQVDWANSEQLPQTERKKLWILVQFALESPAIRSACGWMKVQELTTEAATKAKLDMLRSYANAFSQEQPTVEFKSVKAVDIKQALTWGNWLRKFEKKPGGPVIKVVMPEQEFQDLIADEGVAKDFVTYVGSCDPLLHAKTGKEISSFIETHKHKPPHQYKGKVKYVRNFHRFEGKALDKLEDNYREKLKPDRKDKPLVLILHSAIDETGAFHHDKKLSEVIEYPQNHTLMIEGARSLGEAGDKVPKIAKQYGQKGKIQQAMIAGHGNSQVIELAGDTSIGQQEKIDPNDPTKKVKEGVLETSEEPLLVGDQASDEFFKILFASSDPKARIVLNACLTNSNQVSNSDPAIKKAQMELDVSILNNDTAKIASAKAKLETAVSKYIDTNPSIVTDLKNKYPGRDVIGANASIEEVDLIDKSTGNLGIISGEDPEVLSSKLDYIEKGIEPTGVLKAVAECWGKFPTQWESRVDARLKSASGDWRDTGIIRPIFELIKKYYVKNFTMINKFVHTANALSHLTSESNCRVSSLRPAVPVQHIKDLFPPLMPDSSWLPDVAHGPVVIYQVWLGKDSSKIEDLTAFLGQNFNCSKAAKFLDKATLLPYIATAMGLPDSGDTRKGKILLALWLIANNELQADAKVYLTGLAGTTKQLPPEALAILGSYKGLDGDEILYRIGAKQKPGSTPSPGSGTVDKPKNNADTNADGTNDVLVSPLSGSAKVTADVLKVHSGPGTNYAAIGKLWKGYWVDTVGKSDNWLAVEYKFRLGYIHGDFVKFYAK